MKNSTSQNTREASEKSGRTLIDRLRELVVALDRRIPHLDREGEPGIAHDSAALKKEAQERIVQLETDCPEGTPTRDCFDHRRPASS